MAYRKRRRCRGWGVGTAWVSLAPYTPPRFERAGRYVSYLRPERRDILGAVTLKIARTQVSSCAKPRLWTIYQNDKGILTDVHALSYEILDTTTLEKELDPDPVVAKTALPVDSCGVGGGKLSQGRYCIARTFAADFTLGKYTIRWYFTPEDGDDEIVVDEPLIITDQAHGSPDYYVTIQDMYDSGVSADLWTPKQVQAAIKQAQALVERATGRYFEPRYNPAARHDGRGGPKLLLREPIVAIEYVKSDYEYYLDFTLDEYYDTFLVCNRHMRGQLKPDDRNNPKIEFSYHSRPYGPLGRFPDGSHDVKIGGVFGYTDPTGAPMGETPEDILYVMKLLAWKYTPPANSEEADELQKQSKIISERTRDQAVTYATAQQMSGGGGGSGGGYNVGSLTYVTGDPAIDSILYRYKAGPYFTGA